MADAPTDAAYADGTASTERRVEDLLSRMTLEEKAAQLGSIQVETLLSDGELDREAAGEALEDGIGHLTRVGGGGSLPPGEAAAVANELQSILAETRLGIPAIPHEECLSGYMGPAGTIFPQGIGMASTWDPGIQSEMTAAIRSELSAIGAAHALSPVLDIARDLRWGRVEETYGEDPYLAGAMATAFVEGLQGDGPEEGISATLKHYAGHGVGEGGKNRSSVAIGERELREVHLFPFEAAIRVGGAESVMNAYHDIDGVPCAASEWLLTDVLRGEFGFEGTVVSDYYSVDFLRAEHGVAQTRREAAVSALEAGVDVELPHTDCYETIPEAVREGDLAAETVDTAVRRVLRIKFEKGLFEDRTVDADAAEGAVHTAAARELSREAARESVVILQNEDDLLPLATPDSVAVIGPQADSRTAMLGDYAYPAHYPEEEYEFDATTPLAAIRDRVAEGTAVIHERGCTTTGPSTGGFDAAAGAAADADVAVAFVGARSAVDFADPDDDIEARPTVSTSGEGRDVTDLGLPGVQAELVERLAGTDTPTVVVLLSGKPHAIEAVADAVPAVVQAWLPGEEGGNALFDVLFEGVDPGGRLPVSMPRSVGQAPTHYSRRPNTASETYIYDDGSPLYPFGHGHSYADFEYGDLSLSTASVAPSGTVTATVDVTNAADRPGVEVLQLYASAEAPGLARPVQELVGFQRVALEAGETATVEFELSATQLAYHDEHVNLAVEAGPYELRLGRSSEAIVDTADLEVTDTAAIARNGRRYFTRTAVHRD